MRLFALISIFSFIFSNINNDALISQSTDSLSVEIEIQKNNSDYKDKKIDKMFGVVNKLENVFYVGLGLGFIVSIFLDRESDFYYNKYEEYKDLYEFNNKYNGYLSRAKAYSNGAKISKYITFSSTIILVLNKIYKQKKSKKQISKNQIEKNVKVE